jgi:tetratricopeptide (TPR) repeat protein
LRAQALVKDILMSRLEVDAEINAQEYVHTQGFDDLGKALAASRALQVAFEGFRAVVPAARPNLSMILDSCAPDEAASSYARLSVEQKELLDSAKPSQVLITQAFYDRIAHYQPALRSSPLRVGIYEFLWTSEQRLDELQAEAEFMPTLIQPTLSAVETVTVPPVRPPVKPPVKAAVEPRWKEPEPERVPPPQPEADEPVPAKWLSTAKILAICSAVEMLVAVGYLVNLRVFGNRTKPVPSSVQVQATVAPTPKPAPAAPPSTDKPTGPQTDPGQTPATPPPLPAKPRKVPATTQDAPTSDQPTTPKQTTKPRGCSIEIDEIPSYLSLADSYRNRGKYDRAILEYNAILSCQPSNRQARDGLRNALDAERLQ